MKSVICCNFTASPPLVIYPVLSFEFCSLALVYISYMERKCLYFSCGLFADKKIQSCYCSGQFAEQSCPFSLSFFFISLFSFPQMVKFIGIKLTVFMFWISKKNKIKIDFEGANPTSKDRSCFQVFPLPSIMSLKRISNYEAPVKQQTKNDKHKFDRRKI